VADLTFLPALPRVVRRNVKSKSHTRIIWLLVSLWFRRLYESVLQNDTNVGTGTLDSQKRVEAPQLSQMRYCDSAM
jgi:hypothetical protein